MRTHLRAQYELPVGNTATNAYHVDLEMIQKYIFDIFERLPNFIEYFEYIYIDISVHSGVSQSTSEGISKFQNRS